MRAASSIAWSLESPWPVRHDRTIPAAATSALTQTVRPSYWLPWTSIDLPSLMASSMISFQVASSPWFGTKSLRYQSS